MTDTEDSNLRIRSVTKSRWKIPKRYEQALLSCLGLFIISWMSDNFGVVSTYKYMKRLISTEKKATQEAWTFEDINYVESSLYWSHACAQIPGALLVIQFSAHRVLWASIVLSSILHMTVPLALDSVTAMLIIRILEGLVTGPIYSASLGIWRSWAPAEERTRLVTIGFIGSYMGEALGNLLSLHLTEAYGEGIPFILSGIFGLFWCILWFFVTYESPSAHPSISHYELTFLDERTVDYSKKNDTVKSIPWKCMLRSMPIWAICIASFCYSYCLYMAVVGPVLHFHLTSSAELSHTLLVMLSPHLIIAIIMPIGSFLGDYVIKKKCIETTEVRKIFCSGAFLLHGVLLLSAAFIVGCVTGLVILSIASGALGMAIMGFQVNCIDLSPRYASLVLGISNTFGVIGWILSSVAMIGISPNFELQEWQNVFFVTSGLSFVGALIYGVMGSCRMQSWDDPHDVGNVTTENKPDCSTYYSYDDKEDQSVLATAI